MPHMDIPKTDESLVAELSAGSDAALTELVGRHGRWLRGVVYSVLGRTDELDDVAQQVWSSVWQRRGELGEIRNWRNWLYTAGRRTAIDAGRSRGRRRRLTQTLADRPPRSSHDGAEPARKLILADQVRHTVEAVGELPEKYRSVLVLRVWQEQSYEQIADTLGLPSATVGTRLVRARQMLRRKLSDRSES